MLRSLIISLTIVSTAFGSLGVPVYLHTCRMMEEVSAIAGCSMCAGMEEEHEATADENACCHRETVNQRTDAGTMPRVEMPVAPMVLAAAVFVSLETALRASIDEPIRTAESPPGLDARAAETYLRNSTFLI